MPTLREIFSNTADAIRTKTGKSDLISPPNFPQEIDDIEKLLEKINPFESQTISLLAQNGVSIESYTIVNGEANINFSESSAGYEGCILGSFENLEIGKSYLLKFEYEFNDAQIMTGYCLGAGVVVNPVNDYESFNQFNNFVRDSNRHSILLFFDYNVLNTNLVLNLSALDDAHVNKFKLENIRIYEIDSNI